MAFQTHFHRIYACQKKQGTSNGLRYDLSHIFPLIFNKNAPMEKYQKYIWRPVLHDFVFFDMA